MTQLSWVSRCFQNPTWSSFPKSQPEGQQNGRPHALHCWGWTWIDANFWGAGSNLCHLHERLHTQIMHCNSFFKPLETPDTIYKYQLRLQFFTTTVAAAEAQAPKVYQEFQFTNQNVPAELFVYTQPAGSNDPPRCSCCCSSHSSSPGDGHSLPQWHHRATEHLLRVRSGGLTDAAAIAQLLRYHDRRLECSLHLRLPRLRHERRHGQSFLRHQAVRCHHSQELRMWVAWLGDCFIGKIQLIVVSFYCRLKAGRRYIEPQLNGEVG